MIESGIYHNSELEDTTYVVFGGKIGFSLGSNLIGEKLYKGVFLEELSKNYGVGKKIREDWDKEKPQVQLLFDKIESVDTMIYVLNDLKEYLKQK